MAVDLREYAASLTWFAVGVVLWLAALLFVENILGAFSMVSIGLGVASAIQTRKRLEGTPRSRDLVENRLDELETRLAEAEIENARLRAEADFDRQLRSGDQP